MKVIILNNGGFTKVDDDVYLWASKTKWCKNLKGAVQNTKSGKLLHRLIMRAPDGIEIDHHNHDTLDNQRQNLRLCTHAQNNMNRVAKINRKYSKYKAVDPNGKKWKVRIGVDGKVIYLGTYPTDKVAALVYNKAALFYFGEFACLNVIDID